MTGAYFTRLAAVCVVAALMGAIILKPQAGLRYAEKAAALKPQPQPVVSKTCSAGEPVLTGPFAPIEDVLSISPLGGVTAPGETLPAPTIRVNTRQGETVFERRTTNALAPATAVVTAVERFATRNKQGIISSVRWKVHFSPCTKMQLFFDDLDTIDPSILSAIGGLATFEEIGGPDHLAKKTSIRVKRGMVIGEADGFDVGLIDEGAAPISVARPERYAPSPYAHATAVQASAETLKAVAINASKARCPLDYLPTSLAGEWSAKLGDAWGMRRSKGDDACRTAIVDMPGTVQGAWFTDASHNSVTDKVSAVALAPDAIDPSRQIFALHGRLKSLSADFVGLNPRLVQERKNAVQGFLTFEAGDGRINTPFMLVKEHEIACYQGMRANFVGPRINAVILVQTVEEKGATLMKMEARGDALSCIDLPEPWTFTGNETTFYR